MKYFILSPYWTRHYKEDIYWGPNSNGYTSILANAGVYGEGAKERMGKLHELDRCTFVPITQEMLDKGYIQLKEQTKECNLDLDREQARHLRTLACIQENQDIIKAGYEKLMSIAEEAGC